MRKRFLATIAAATAMSLSIYAMPANAAPLQPVASVSATAQTPTQLPAAPSAQPALAVSPAASVAAFATPGLAVRPAVIPIVAAIIAAIIRVGVSQAIRHFGKTAVKKALRTKLLSSTAQRWTHILAKKHNWHKLGAAGNKSKVTEYLVNAVANGKKANYGSGAYSYTWVTKGQRVVAIVAKNTGTITNGWVK